MEKLRIILSFDHELPLGGGPSFSRTLFEPTQELLNLAAELDVPMAFFTDILCAMRFVEWDEEGFFRPYRAQLGEMLRQGHDVQLHLHPHWLDSEFRDGTYIPSDSFSFQSFETEQSADVIGPIVRQSLEFLNQICSEFVSDYRCIAYRAGGYNLSPQHVLLPVLYENGIRIDSSIGKDYTYHSPLSDVNFRHMPSAANWTFSENGPVNSVSDCGIFEIPIASRPRNPWNSLPFAFKLFLLKYRSSHTGSRGIHQSRSSLLDKLKIGFPFSAWLLKLDRYTDSPAVLMKTLKYHIRRHSHEDTITCAAIGHPNIMGAYHHEVVSRFVKDVRREFNDSVEFCTYRQIYDEMQAERKC